MGFKSNSLFFSGGGLEGSGIIVNYPALSMIGQYYDAQVKNCFSTDQTNTATDNSGDIYSLYQKHTSIAKIYFNIHITSHNIFNNYMQRKFLTIVDHNG